jgi:transcription antitermination factor NusG
MARRYRRRWLLALSQRIYRVLLLAYPGRFRRAYGADMAQVFGDCCRHALWCHGLPGLLRLWMDTLLDLLATVPREHLAGLVRPRGTRAATPMPAYILVASRTTRRLRRISMRSRNSLAGRIKRFFVRARPQPSGQPMSDRDRFDKFTKRARKVLRLSQEEAQRLHHTCIGTEHLLLGLVREADGVAAKVLSNLGVELDQVRRDVEFIIGSGDRAVLGEIGLTPRAKKAIHLAVEEGQRLGHLYIGTEHLLLGLVREGEGIAADVLKRQGVKLDDVRAQTLHVLGQPDGGPHDDLPDQSGTPPEPKLTFQVGQSVKVIDGPFAGCTGTVLEIDLEREKVTVLVSFLGREISVQLDFLQVEKV